MWTICSKKFQIMSDISSYPEDGFGICEYTETQL